MEIITVAHTEIFTRQFLHASEAFDFKAIPKYIILLQWEEGQTGSASYQEKKNLICRASICSQHIPSLFPLFTLGSLCFQMIILVGLI